LLLSGVVFGLIILKIYQISEVELKQWV
jgi:hypothetical protein